MSADHLNKSYTKEFNSINTAVNDATSEDNELVLRCCRMRARALLDEPTIPLYHRIKTLLLLAIIVGRPSNMHLIELLLLLMREQQQKTSTKRLPSLEELKRR
jgi:hypothetical protein